MQHCAYLAGLSQRSPLISAFLSCASAGLCAVDAGAAVEPAPCSAGTQLQWEHTAWWGQHQTPAAGGKQPLCGPLATTAKPSIVCKMKISSLLPSAVCGELLPFPQHRHKKSLESALHTRHPCVGGFVHFWWVFSAYVLGEERKLKSSDGVRAWNKSSFGNKMQCIAVYVKKGRLLNGTQCFQFSNVPSTITFNEASAIAFMNRTCYLSAILCVKVQCLGK